MKFTISFCVLLCTGVFWGQSQEKKIDESALLEDKIVRLNLLSLGFGIELKTSNYSSLSISSGVSNSWIFPPIDDEASTGGFDFVYSIEPFLNVDHKFFYNLKKRLEQGKNISFNSGNYFSIRTMTMGKAIAGDIQRKNDYQFYIIPSWGFQRSYNRIHFLFDVGPLYIFDGKGNKGFFPLFFRVNLGYNF